MLETGNVIASIIGVAGAGFRLSLILNAVGAEIADTDVEIQSIARGISSFCLMLKQVGISIQATRTLTSQSAIDTVSQITKQSQSVFDEVKKMVEMVQKKDEKGNIQSISIAQRVTWCFKKQRIQYMLGQLECLQLSLSLMLQVLQLGKIIASEREEPTKQPLSEREMLQERAEIQNMVVVRHWSLVDLRRLYQHAEHEDVDAVERPLPIHNGITPAEADPRLQIEAAKDETDPSTAMVKYKETPLSHLDASMNKAMYLSNRLLHAPDDNIVDHLLDEWTRLRELHPRSPRRENKYRSHYDTDDDSSSDTNFERSEGNAGKYIEGPKSRKNVRFRARVESDSDDSDKSRQRRKAPSRHVLHSDEDTDSSSSSPPPRSARRNSDGNTTRRAPNPQETPNERNRRPYTSPYTPSPRDGVPEPQSGRPSSRGGPPPSRPMPMQIPSQNWQNQHQPATPSLRPPPYNPAFPSSPQRMPSGGPYMPPPPGYGTSPQAPRNYLPQPQGLAVPYNDNGHSHKKRSPRRDKPKKSQSGSSFKENAKKDVKRGLLGAGAVAGLMDILEGLGTI